MTNVIPFPQQAITMNEPPDDYVSPFPKRVPPPAQKAPERHPLDPVEQEEGDDGLTPEDQHTIGLLIGDGGLLWLRYAMRGPDKHPMSPP